MGWRVEKLLRASRAIIVYLDGCPNFMVTLSYSLTFPNPYARLRLDNRNSR